MFYSMLKIFFLNQFLNKNAVFLPDMQCYNPPKLCAVSYVFRNKNWCNSIQRKFSWKTHKLKKYPFYFVRTQYLFSSYNVVEAATCSSFVIYINSYEY